MREFSHPVQIDPWPAGGVTFDVRAQPAERRSLGERLGVDALARFEVAGRIDRVGGRFLLDGRLQADVVQTCVVSLEPFTRQIDEPVRLVLDRVRESDEAAVDPDELDVIPVEGPHVDLGQVFYEELALRLDPHPRASGATLDALEAPPDVPDESAGDWRARLARLALAG